MANQTAAVPFGAVATLREVSLIQTLFASFVSWKAKRDTRKQLLKLSDQQLEDIGLYRSDIA